MQDFEDGDYRTAIRDFDTFIATNPEDAAGRQGAGDAVAGQRPAIHLAQRLDLDLGTGGRPIEMLDSAGAAGPPEAFGDERSELAELVLRIGEGLADRARHGADPKALAEAESAVPLHAQVAGEPAAAFLSRSRLPSKLAEARAAVKKAQVRAAVARRDGPGARGRIGLARLPGPRRPGRPVRRPRPRPRADRADDGRQRADPQGA